FLEGMSTGLRLPPDLWERVHKYHALTPMDRAFVIEELEDALSNVDDGAGGGGHAPAPPKQSQTSLPQPVPSTGNAQRSKPPRPNGKTVGVNKSSARVAIGPETPLSALSGVGPARAKRLQALELETAG